MPPQLCPIFLPSIFLPSALVFGKKMDGKKIRTEELSSFRHLERQSAIIDVSIPLVLPFESHRS